MPIEFRCSQCNQLLRVPDDSAGKNARCPKCQSLMIVPASEAAGPGGGLPSASGLSGLPPLSEAGNVPAADSFPANLPGGGGAPPAKPPSNPFSDKNNPFGEQPALSTNPYATSLGTVQTSPMQPIGAVPISPRPVPVDAIWSYAWEVWKSNLGLLVGVTIVTGVINYATAAPFSFVQAGLQQNGHENAAIATFVIGQFINSFIQLYLGIGQMQIVLKLARWQPAKFSDLFGGLPRVLPVFAGSVLFMLATILGLLLLIVPAFLLILACWPYYYLLVDQKAGIIESFSVAASITKGNWGTSLLLMLLSVAIILVGCAALCIGVLFAAPLVSVLMVTAYLMMSGQIPIHPSHARYGMQP